jgi:hypothetical protein
MRRVIGAVLLLAGVTLPAQLRAQWENVASIASHMEETGMSCVASLPPAGMPRMVVFLEAQPRDEISMKLSNEATVEAGVALLAIEDDFVAAMTSRIKRELTLRGDARGDVPADSLPAADQRLSWRDLAAHLLVTIHRDGIVHVRPLSGSLTQGDSTGLRLLSAAADSVQRSDAKLRWPESQPGDSVIFGVNFIAPTIDSHGARYQVSARRAFSVFSISEPWFEDVKPLNHPRITYPEAPRRAGYMASVTLGFLVDTTGRVVPGSVVTIPSRGQTLTGDQQSIYNRFEQVSREAVAKSQFSPASISGCKVRVRASQQYSFQLAR